MATAASDPPPATGRVDASGRLVSAGPRLEALQQEAGSEVGRALAIPQIAAVARLAKELGTRVRRPAMAATRDHDLELWVCATPDAEGVEIAIDSWIERPPAGPRLAHSLGGRAAVPVENQSSWSVNESLQINSLSQELADWIDIAVEEAIGQPLTKLLRLEENESGELPLLTALAARTSFNGQRARARREGAPVLLLRGDIATGPDGEFAGLSGSAEVEGSAEPESTGVKVDQLLDEALRSPLDRIIEQADRIVEESDGPIQPDYAAYGNDIAAAARHLLSVIQGMSQQASEPEGTVNLAAIAEEAAVMLEALAEERSISVQLQAGKRLRARGDRRAVIQILVNLVGNAIRHSPGGGEVCLHFGKHDGMARVSIEDRGPGIAPGDEERIFERFERATDDPSGTGLGLAIARRLARSMGGDVTLDRKDGPGARFSLSLPQA